MKKKVIMYLIILLDILMIIGTIDNYENNKNKEIEILSKVDIIRIQENKKKKDEYNEVFKVTIKNVLDEENRKKEELLKQQEIAKKLEEEKKKMITNKAVTNKNISKANTSVVVKQVSYNNNIKVENKEKVSARSLASANYNEYIAITNLTNNYRRQVGLNNLVLDRRLSELATIRAIEMGESGIFEHQRPDGSRPSTILTNNGVYFEVFGENIAMLSKNISRVERVAKGWYNSIGHRQNMLSTDFNKIGIGKYEASNGLVYFVQLFMD